MSAMSNFPELLGLIAVEIGGIFAVASLFDKKAKERRAQENEQEDRVISLFKEQVSTLSDRWETSQKEMKDLDGKVNRLEGENRLMRELLSNRDPGWQDFQRIMVQTAKIVETTYNLVVAINTKVDFVAPTVSQLRQGEKNG